MVIKVREGTSIQPWYTDKTGFPSLIHTINTRLHNFHLTRMRQREKMEFTEKLRCPIFVGLEDSIGPSH